MKEQVIPPAALRDEHSIEMLRVWIAEQGLHCSVKVGFYRDNGRNDEAKSWGIILADVVRHISNAMAERYDEDKQKAVQAIVRSFAKELELPTSEANGYFWQQ